MVQAVGQPTTQHIDVLDDLTEHVEGDGDGEVDERHEDVGVGDPEDGGLLEADEQRITKGGNDQCCERDYYQDISHETEHSGHLGLHPVVHQSEFHMGVTTHGVAGTEQYGPDKGDDNDFLCPCEGMIHDIPEEYLQKERQEHDGKRCDREVDLKYDPDERKQFFHNANLT